MEKFSDLHFVLESVFVGVDSIALTYISVLDKKAVEIFFFDESGKVVKAVVHCGIIGSAELILYSLDFELISQWEHEGQWDQIASSILETSQKLQSAGADFILIASNYTAFKSYTATKCQDRILRNHLPTD